MVKIPDRSNYLPKYSAIHKDNVPAPIFGMLRKDAGKANDGHVEDESLEHTLVSLSNTYEFFTTGVLAVAPRLQRDLLIEFCNQHPASVPEAQPVAIDYESRFFAGFPPVASGIDYNRRIYMVVKNRWPLLRDMIASAAFLDSNTGYYARVNYYNLEMVDPFALKKQRVVIDLPKVNVCVFGYSSTHSFSHIASAEFPRLPMYRKDPPKVEIVIERDSRWKQIVV